MPKNLNTLDRLLRLAFAALLLFLALAVFKNPLARLVVAFGGLWSLWEAASAKCPLSKLLGSTGPAERLKSGAVYLIGVAGVQLILAYEWLHAGWGKVSSPAFVENIQKTLGYFASQNPFTWCKDFLLGFATQNATLFAYAVEWSEIIIGLGLFGATVWLVYQKGYGRAARAVLVIALLGSMLMNAAFYLAAGWTSPGTAGVNVVMFWSEAALVYVWLTTWTSGSASLPRPMST